MSPSPFDALGDPTRRRILELLTEGQQSVGTLHASLATEHAVSQPAVSQHLRVLREAGLVDVRADGTRRLYSLDRSGLGEAHAWLEHLLDEASAFVQPLDALATEVARGRRAAQPSSPGEERDPRPRRLPGAAEG